jgi:neutral ceramidase
MFVLYDLTALGFIPETFYALVRGITQSIINAHNNMNEGRIFISETEIDNANINRSPSAYVNNPTEEKAQYRDNVDKKLIQLRFMDKNNKNVMGAFNWFAGKFIKIFFKYFLNFLKMFYNFKNIF